MKQVTFLQTTTVGISQVDKGKYYGFQHHNDEEKGFLISGRYNQDEYNCICLRGLTYGNNWGSNRKMSLQQRINEMRNYGKIYEFNTAEEMLKWLIE